MRERTGRVKVRKLVGGDEDNLTGKAKSMHASKQSKTRNSHGQGDAQPCPGKLSSVTGEGGLARETLSL